MTSRDLTRVHIVRHAHAEWFEDERRPLSRSGTKAAAVVAQRLLGVPIRAIYSSPSRRAVDTVAPLAARLGRAPMVVVDLCERELPAVARSDFYRVVRDTWRRPGEAPYGGESNAAAQARGLAVLHHLLARHDGEQFVIATHGTLMALVLNALDPSFDYEFWTRLSFPDIYSLAFEASRLVTVERLWDPDAAMADASGDDGTTVA